MSTAEQDLYTTAKKLLKNSREIYPTQPPRWNTYDVIESAMKRQSNNGDRFPDILAAQYCLFCFCGNQLDELGRTYYTNLQTSLRCYDQKPIKLAR